MTKRIAWKVLALAAIFAVVWWRASLFAAAAATIVAAAVSVAFRARDR